MAVQARRLCGWGWGGGIEEEERAFWRQILVPSEQGHIQADKPPLCFGLFFRDLQVTYLSPMQLVLCRLAAVKRLLIHHHSADYIRLDYHYIFGSLSSFSNFLKIGFRLGQC